MNETTLRSAKAHWIWPSTADGHADLDSAKHHPVFANFRTTINLAKVPESFTVTVCADARYKLIVNGEVIQTGPAKTCRTIRCYDEIDLSDHLRQGCNIIAVIVLHYPADQPGNYSIASTSTPGLWMSSPMLNTDSSWKSVIEPSRQIISENAFYAPLQIMESYTPIDLDDDWTTSINSAADQWRDSYEYSRDNLADILLPESLHPRSIPFMKSEKCEFQDANLLKQTIPAHSAKEVTLNAGELMTGFLRITVARGKGAKLNILESEGYVKYAPENPKSFEDQPVKGDRTDSVNGTLAGFTDRYTVAGFGTKETPEVFEPFWFRTFRYVRLHITTGDQPLDLLSCTYRICEYPLQVSTTVDIDNDLLSDIQNMSLRTLRRCMHETYEDCPFYEQLQYIMDTRSEILYTYSVSADDKLARQAIEAFMDSQQPDGLLNSCSPSNTLNIIPGYSIYFIATLFDHMMYFDDKDLLKRSLPTIKRILNFFNSNCRSDGLIDVIGGIDAPNPRWSFIDWTPEWKQTRGVPPAINQGPLTMESLLAVMGYQYAAQICDHLGESSTAKQYRVHAARLQKAINCLCRNDEGMYTDGPDCNEVSQHCQVFAILTRTISPEEGRSNLSKTLDDTQHYAQCSIAMTYYLFRALEMTGLYDRTTELWKPWEDMLANHLTTSAEDNLSQRSDCHAWGSVALYELPSAILGVRPAEPGYRSAIIDPHPAGMLHARGTVATPLGQISVSWSRESLNDRPIITAKGPEKIKLIIREN